jgi:putative Mg2+ transporter-C (MgtC) family protein
VGAGTILRGDGRIQGLTTAATIWLIAALGMGIGSEHYAVVVVGTTIVLVVLWIFPIIERWIDNVRHTEIYEIVCPITPDAFESLHALFAEHRLRVISVKRHKIAGNLVSLWEVHGSPRGHRALTDALLAHDEVIEFQV